MPHKFNGETWRITYILLVFLAATILIKFKTYFRSREPANRPFIYDHYEAKPRMMIPDYMRSLQRDSGE